MINTVILDVGNVLVDYCWEKHFHDLGLSGDIFEKVANATVRNVDWDEYDRGVLTDEEILNRFIENDPSVEKEIRLVNQDLGGVVDPYPYAKEWIMELKEKGLKVYILSNFSDKCFKDCGDKLDFVKYTDGALFSYEEKLIKPDDAIYQRILKRFKLKPECCVFFDDRLNNIQGACENGIHGIVFENLSQAKRDLDELIAKEA